MKFKEYLQNLIKAKNDKLKELKERSDKSEDIAEVRSIGIQMDAIVAEKREAEEQLAKIEAEERASINTGAEPETTKPDMRNAWVVGAFTSQTAKREKNVVEDRFDSEEYRNAFMEYVCRGTAIPTELRADAVTTTGDAGAVIPTTLMNEIVQKMDTYGNIYKLIRKLNVQGGIAIPVLSLKPEATWIGEKNSSEDKKLNLNEKITFSYYGVECKISQTLLVNVTTLSMFQQLFVPLATEAIVRAVEKSIFVGNGTSQPLGILKDTRVPASNVIALSPSEAASWAGWHKVKAKMKKAYRNGIFIMNQATFDVNIDGMEDDNGQPIGRTNYGVNGEENYRFMGKDVETVEDDILPDFASAGTGDTFAIFIKPTDYAINSNLSMQTVKWTDHDTNEIKNKCIMICDGKLIDPNGVLLIKKGAPEA